MIASLHEEAQLVHGRVRYGENTFWGRKAGGQARKRLWKMWRRTFETIPSPNYEENINIV